MHVRMPNDVFGEGRHHALHVFEAIPTADLQDIVSARREEASGNDQVVVSAYDATASIAAFTAG